MIICPDCGAHSNRGVSRCWLCTADLPEEIVTAELVPEPPAARSFSFTLMSVLGVITLVAVAFGIVDTAPGLSLLIGLVGAPALIVTSVRSGRRRAVGQQMSWSESVASFLRSAAMVVGVLILLSLSGFLALFLVCVFAIRYSGL